MFDNAPPVTADPQPTGTEVKFKVGDREYDLATAATKIQHADTHIGTLESELKTLRDKLALTEAQKLALESMSSHTAPPSPAPTSAPTIDREALLAEAEQRMFDKLNVRQQEALAQQNLEAATAEAKRVYGDSYQQVLLERGSELGMNKEDIMSFAKTKPEAFKKLFNITASTAKGQVPPSSSYRPSSADSPNVIQNAAKAAIDRSLSGRQRTEAIALALAPFKK